MIDIKEDREQRDHWISTDPQSVAMKTDDLVQLAIHGLETCPDFCGSREMLGEGECFCVRARFPSAEHYFLYLELRNVAKKLAGIAFLSSLTKED